MWRSDNEPRITRRRAGTGFSYRAPTGSIVDETTRARIERLAIPPAWTDVWICVSSNGHLQATGRDARGRKQYPYHPDFRAHRDAVKFDHLVEFGESLAPIRRQVAADIALPALPKTKVMALVVRLLEETMIRVRNEEYARANTSYGLTTLRDRHAKFTTSGLRLVFTSKHGVRTDVAVPDQRARVSVSARVPLRLPEGDERPSLFGRGRRPVVHDERSTRPAPRTLEGDRSQHLVGVRCTLEAAQFGDDGFSGREHATALHAPHARAFRHALGVERRETPGEALTPEASQYIDQSLRTTGDTGQVVGHERMLPGAGV